MPFFRWRRKSQDTAPEAGAQHPEQQQVEQTTTAEPAARAGSDAAQRRRRRGGRGSRGRKKPAEPAEQAAAAPKAERKPETKAEKRPERKPRQERRAQTRRRPPARKPLPAAKRELLISVDAGEQRVAILEDDRVAEVYLERPERRSIAGNIYLGTVDNVLPGMEAAFIEIGLEKNGFLYVDEIVVPELEGKRHGKKIQDLISRSQQILVQAVKDPMKTKGARLTTEISLPGRFLVFVPHGEGLGVSRRLDDAERTRLKEIIKALDVKQGGVIVRTAAEGASAEDVERDLVFLQRLWKTIQARAKAAKAPALVYQEAELPLRIVRDLFAGDFERALIDHERTYKRIVGYLKKTSPHMIDRVERHKEKERLFEAFGVDAEIRSTLSRRVDLPSGGYLIFDYAEAFTVVDVNTGRFVGSRAKTSNARLEDTITKNNLEAVKEVVRQLRLRDIGGIIVIDFIDMANPKNRATVEEALRQELERDRTKTYVVEISPLGLVEMTRQNVTDGPREILTKKCPVCEGDGIVVSEASYAMEVERRLRSLAAGSRAQAFRVAVHPRILSMLAGPGGSRLEEVEALAKKRFYLVPAESNGHVHLDHVAVLAEGKREELAPSAPVEEGAQVELKLVEVDLHDAAAGVGKLDGYDVVVAEAATLVGKRQKVRVARVLDGAAYAVLVGGKAKPEEPVTFEGEAEKPTRAPSRKKAEEPAAAEEPEAEPAEEPAAEEPVAEEPEEEAESEEGEPKPKKRTRRGSRGGRRRKKKPADGAEEPTAEPEEPAAEEEAEEEPSENGRRPRIHVPGPELGEESETDEPPEAEAGGEPKPRKKTRRGTRGGRGRKKTTAVPVGEGPGAEPEPAQPEEYVPMSEWLDDFER